MDTENIFTTDANRKEVKEIRENVSKLELISNQILADLEKDFTFSEQQHTVEMKNMQTELNRVRQKFDNDRNAIRSNNEIAAVRRDMNNQLNGKEQQIQQLRKEKEAIKNELSNLRRAILDAVGK